MRINKYFLVAALAFGLAHVASAHAAIITFGPATNIVGDTDVYTGGTLEYAYAWSSFSPVVNGVPFSSATSTVGDGSGDVTWGFDQRNTTAYGGSGLAPFSGLSAAYQNLLRGAVYNEFASAPITVNLNNLTPGTAYAVQLWYHDDRACCGAATQTVTSVGGNSIVLTKGVAATDGGVGDYTIGFFTADAVSQAFTVASGVANNTQINALQVRAIPEPGTLTLAAFGLIAGWRVMRRRMR